MRGQTRGASAAVLALCFLLGSAARAGEPSGPSGSSRGALSVGARLGALARDHEEISGPRDPSAAAPDVGYFDTGLTVEADVGYHFVPALTVYGFWEHAFFFDPTGRDPSGDMVGLGLHADSRPSAPVSLFVDLGQGYRWLSVPMSGVPPPPLQVDGHPMAYPTPPSVTLSYRGWDFVRLGLGASFALTRRARWEVAATGSMGVFTNLEGLCSSCSSTIPTPGRSVHGFGGITVSAHWDVVP